MKLLVTAPPGLGDLIAELVLGGALRVSTRSHGEDDPGLAALTVVHLDGDVTTSITPACLAHPDAHHLFRRHAQEMRRIDELLRHGAARLERVVMLVSSAAVVAGVAIDAATGHSSLHLLGAFLTLGGAGVAVIKLVRRFAHRLLVRSTRRAVARQKDARGRPPGPVPPG
jgi:hypothetical protein